MIRLPHGYYRGGAIDNNYCPTLTTSAWEHNNFIMAKVYRIRKLTPRECFRLMGVSDEDISKIQNYPLVPDGKGGFEPPANMTVAEMNKLTISESQQYKMAGNSIVVQVLEGIFTQMFSSEREEGLTLFG